MNRKTAVMEQSRKIGEIIELNDLLELILNNVYSGMHWTVRGMNSIIALRCSILSNRWEDFWEHRAAVKKKGSYFKDKYYRLKARRGAKKAIMAIAHRKSFWEFITSSRTGPSFGIWGKIT